MTTRKAVDVGSDRDIARAKYEPTETRGENDPVEKRKHLGARASKQRGRIGPEALRGWMVLTKGDNTSKDARPMLSPPATMGAVPPILPPIVPIAIACPIADTLSVMRELLVTLRSGGLAPSCRRRFIEQKTVGRSAGSAPCLRGWDPKSYNSWEVKNCIPAWRPRATRRGACCRQPRRIPPEVTGSG